MPFKASSYIPPLLKLLLDFGWDKAKTEGMVNTLYDFTEHFDNSYMITLYGYGYAYIIVTGIPDR